MARRPIDPTTGQPRARLAPGRKPMGAVLAPINLTPHLRAEVQAAADAAGLTLAAWVRRAIEAHLRHTALPDAPHSAQGGSNHVAESD